MGIFTTKNLVLGGIFACQSFLGFSQTRQADSLALVNLYNSTSGPTWANQANWASTAPMNTWYGITLTSGRVTSVVLPSNKLSGVYPDLIGQLTALQELNLSSNSLTGSLPYMGNGSLQVLNLSNNQLSGSVPDWNNFNSLQTLNLANNQLSGSFSNQNLAVIQNLDLSNNQFSGAMPYPNNLTIKTINLSHNQFTGEVHNFWQPSGVPNLTSYDVSYNLLTGSLPWIAWAAVTNLNVSNNRLSGALNYYSIPNVHNLDFSKNRFTGEIPYFSIPADAILKVNNNKYTFSQLESRAGAFSATSTYAPQDTLVVIQYSSGSLSVNAGGTTAKNTYNWYLSGGTLAATTTGNSTYTPTQNGTYYVEVTNSDVPLLTLVSNTVNVSTLPVKLLSFKAALKGSTGSYAQLTWETASELNSDGFHIERSTDGKDFVPVGFVKSKALNGNSAEKLSYSYTDILTASGQFYYRLRQVDKNGNVEYSNNVAVNTGSLNANITALKLYPNPSGTGSVSVELTEVSASATRIAVLDAAGRIVKTISVPANESSIKIDSRSLISGTYHLLWFNGNKKPAASSFIVQ